MEDALYVLNVLYDSGYEAYLVGGFVRDHLLGVTSTDVDICTSAKPYEVASIFGVPCDEQMGSVKFNYKGLKIDITTFRKEDCYVKRRPSKITFVKSLYLDLSRRDFTINAIAMDQEGKLIDLYNGTIDLNNRIIRAIGDIETKMQEDPLRMLRALRFSIVYDLEIEKNLLDFIVNNKNLFKSLSYERKKEEMTKILESYNAIKGLVILDRYGILEVLEISFPMEIRKTSNYIGMWVQLTFNNNYPFNKTERKKMERIKAILDYGKIDRETLFKYELDDNYTAGEILDIFKEDIYEIFESMPIHKERDLVISSVRIKELLKIPDGPIIKEIKKDLINKVLSGSLHNSVKELEKYILKTRK